MVEVMSQWMRTAKVETAKYIKRKMAANEGVSGRRVPFMEPAGLRALRDQLRSATCFLEYGAGGSTLFSMEMGVPSTVSVESDAAFLAMIEGEIADLRSPAVAWSGLHADIGPTRKWGYPVGDATAAMGLTYALIPWQTELLNSPDVVLVDGRFRAACCLATTLHAKPGTRILFDDYAARPYYTVVEAHLGAPTMFDSLALFTVPASAIDRVRLERDLAEFAADAR